MSKTIINVIDVSECSYYNKDNEPYCCELWDNECEAQNCYFKQCRRLEQELQKYKDMEAKGLAEFKDIGGCWGCGLQLQIAQNCKDIKKLSEKNEQKTHFLEWLITQQYYIIPKNIKNKIKEILAND